MRLVSLNIWGGKAYKPLMAYITESAPSTDFFCFQEVYDSKLDQIINQDYKADILSELINQLPDFKSFYAPTQDNLGGKPISAGLAVFVKNGITVDSTGDLFVYRTKNSLEGEDYNTMPENLQYVRVQKDGKKITIAHVHGVFFPGSKLDTPQRIQQSEIIVKFLVGETGGKILSGDFNLMPETQSIKMIEAAGMKNLIQEYQIPSTRSSLNYAKYSTTNIQRFADYVFTSPGVKVLDFRVPSLPVSDHLPLILDFE